ncbi:MAG: hypothetical protein LBT16_04030 [Treponema sp.]|nr:hypothetical protein [Treponema sp.]
MAKKKNWTVLGLLLALLPGTLVFTACRTPPGPKEIYIEKEVPETFYIPITREIVDEINNRENGIIINSRTVHRPEELQYYISKGIVLERRERKPVLEVNAKGDLLRWEFTTEERLSIGQKTPGELQLYGPIGDRVRPMTISICFDNDERMVLDFRQDITQGNRFYLVYNNESDGSKRINYGETKQYILSFWEDPSPVSPPESSGTDDPPAETVTDSRPYLQIKVADISETFRINRSIGGRRVRN